MLDQQNHNFKAWHLQDQDRKCRLAIRVISYQSLLYKSHEVSYTVYHGAGQNKGNAGGLCHVPSETDVLFGEGDTTMTDDLAHHMQLVSLSMALCFTTFNSSCLVSSQSHFPT